MENKIFLLKVVLIGMVDGFFHIAAIDLFVRILQIIFYSIGAYVLFASAYDSHKKKKNNQNPKQ